MPCYDCEYGHKRHSEIDTDISIVNCFIHSVEHGYIKLAIEEGEKLKRRLEQRKNIVMGRALNK